MSDELPQFKKVVLPGDETPEDEANASPDAESNDEPGVEEIESVQAVKLPVDAYDDADDDSLDPADGSSDPNVYDDEDPSALGEEEDGEGYALPLSTTVSATPAETADGDGGDGDGGDGGDGGGSDDGEDDEEEGQGRMGVLEHLQELRKCLTRIVLSVLVGFLPCYAVASQLFAILMKPMNDAMIKVSNSAATTVLTPEFFKALQESLAQLLVDKGPEYVKQLAVFMASLEAALQKVVVNKGQFIYTYPPEAFFAEVKVAFVAGFFLVSPYIFYQVWRFVAPGLYAHERRWIWPIALVSALFFVAGGCFGYFVVFPVGFEFFAQYSTDMISFMPKLSEYLSFALKLLIAFGVAFELPVFIFFLARIGLVTGRGLLKKGKYFILIAFIVGAVLTPPDPVSQSLMAGPLILLYALGVVIAFLFGKRKPKPEAEPEAEA